MATDIACLGETMVMLVPEDATPLAANSRLVLRVGGAESNVAATMARLGHGVRWVSALGDDPFAGIIRDELHGAGVDLSFVATDEEAPTGLYVKDPDGERTTVYYYRQGSAASRMTANGVLGSGALDGTRLVHVSGTTTALSASCRALTNAIVADRRHGDAAVSFDVNYRPRLWPVAEAAPVLADLSRRADIVFVGRDEAETLWGTSTVEDVRDFLPEPAVLVVKDGAIGAATFGPDGVDWVDARRVDVVETVGAGDAFAAGWLSGWMRGASPRQSLALGHLLASRTVQIVGDCPPVPTDQEIATLFALVEENRA
ncbi:sugar kinase [Microbacterium sp. JZ70]